MRWIAPILSFTADEIWKEIPGKREANVFIAEWFQLPKMPKDSLSNEYWALVASVKTAVNKVLEEKRSEGAKGGSLGAEVTLYCDEKLQTELSQLGDELRFVLITSAATLQPLNAAQNAEDTDVAGLKVFVKATEQPKCERCWHHRADVGANPSHPTICLRCVVNVDGNGEPRNFA